jgi:hypothetical protein
MRCRWLTIATSVILLLTSCALNASEAQVSPVNGASQHSPVPTPSPAIQSQRASPTAQPSTLPAASDDQRTEIEKSLNLYPAPASCATSPLVGPEERKRFPAWWLDGQGIAAGTPIGALFEGGNKIQWHLNTVAALTATGERLDASAPPLKLEHVEGIGTMIDDADSRYSSEVYFPAPGCWRIEAEAGQQTLEATVYVYPLACKPPNMRGPNEAAPAGACVPPQ